MKDCLRIFAGGWLIGKAFDNPSSSSLNQALTFWIGIMLIAYTVLDLIYERK